MRLLILSVIGGLLSLSTRALPAIPADKRALATAVLRQVGATYGFDLLKLPKLVIYPRSPANNHIAKLELALVPGRYPADNLDRSRLLMDEEIIDICRAADQENGAGPGTALAFVLSHEMAHFYRQHAIFRTFADRKTGGLSTSESLRQEREADETGLLFAYLAGYDPEPVLSSLFDKLYSHYKLNDPLPGHPAKANRQQTTTLRTAEFRRYGYLFAVGNALYCRENFAEAARCFEYVYSRYPLKEAYVNFGVCRLQEAMRLKKKTPTDYFALPFEVDPRNRLLRAGERGEPANNADVTRLLDEANAAFRRAIDMDITYKPAYLNQALSGILAGNPLLALGVLVELGQRSGPTLPPNGYLIRGIAYCGLGDLAKAEADFTVATTKKAYQADYNGLIFRAIKNGTVKTIRQPWQRLTPQKPTRIALGCQAGGLLQEVDKAPATLHFNAVLIDQNNPPPYILVSYERVGRETYFRVELDTSDRRSQPVDLFFVLKNSPASGAINRSVIGHQR